MSILQALEHDARVASQGRGIDMHRVKALNRQVFTNSLFRPNQLSLIQAAIQGRKTLGVLPTGAGKSLTYQLPAVYPQQGVTIVVSPINALIIDQVTALIQKDIRALAYTSPLPKKIKSGICNEMCLGDYPFLYTSPEALTDATDPLRTA